MSFELSKMVVNGKDNAAQEKTVNQIDALSNESGSTLIYRKRKFSRKKNHSNTV